MLTVDEYLQIRLAHRDGMTIRQIAKRLGHSRRKVRDVLQLDSGRLREGFRHQMAVRSHAGRNVGQRRAPPRQVEKFPERPHAQRLIDDQHVRGSAEIGDVGEIA